VWGKTAIQGFCQAFLSEGLFSKQRKQQGQEDADKDGSNNGKVESEVLFSDDDISGKPPDPRNFLPNHQKDPDENDKNSH
jgi:hypothetical protein